jgi:hypothetical protein
MPSRPPVMPARVSDEWQREQDACDIDNAMAAGYAQFGGCVTVTPGAR